MKTLKYLFIIVVVLVVGIVVYFSLEDGTYNITQSKTIDAPKEIIFEEISDLKNWTNWNPLLTQRGITFTMGTITSGKGGYYTFRDRYGKGTMTIKKVIANEQIDLEKTYNKDASIAGATVSIRMVKVDNGYNIIWTQKGEKSLTEKITGFFTGSKVTDELTPLYAAGLNTLAQRANSLTNAYQIDVVGIEATSESYYLSIEVSSSLDKLADARATQQQRLLDYINDNNLVMSGKPVVFYDKIDEQYKAVIFRVAIPVPICPNQDPDNMDITCSYKPASDDAVVLLTGDYKNLPEALERAERFVVDERLEKSGLAPYELYLNNPSKVKSPAALRTEIHIPLKKVIIYE